MRNFESETYVPLRQNEMRQTGEARRMANALRATNRPGIFRPLFAIIEGTFNRLSITYHRALGKPVTRPMRDGVQRPQAR